MHISKICYVYIDDIIIFSKNEEDQAKDLQTIFTVLQDVNMKIQIDKCNFFSEKVEFLGFIMTAAGIKTNPAKVQAIEKVPIPKTLNDLRSFLLMSF